MIGKRVLIAKRVMMAKIFDCVEREDKRVGEMIVCNVE